MKIAIGCDHAGYKLARTIEGDSDDIDQTQWFGPQDEESCDYPDYAHKVADAVASGQADIGVLICGTGIGMCMAANKTKGVRAFVARNHYDVEMAIKHNHANVICFGVRVQHEEDIQSLLSTFTCNYYDPDTSERHVRRVRKIG